MIFDDRFGFDSQKMSNDILFRKIEKNLKSASNRHVARLFVMMMIFAEGGFDFSRKSVIELLKEIHKAEKAFGKGGRSDNARGSTKKVEEGT